MNTKPEKIQIIEAIKFWLETVVIELNLCPFAKREFLNNRVRFFVSEALTEEQLLMDLQTELELLNSDKTIETTLLIHPKILVDFYDYNQFLDYTDGLLLQMQLEGIYQIASFHPNYQFAETAPDDVENYTNRSPYPILHLLREESVEKAVANYPNPELIPEQNIKLLESLGKDKMQALLQTCFDHTEN